MLNLKVLSKNLTCLRLVGKKYSTQRQFTILKEKFELSNKVLSDTYIIGRLIIFMYLIPVKSVCEFQKSFWDNIG